MACNMDMCLWHHTYGFVDLLLRAAFHVFLACHQSLCATHSCRHVVVCPVLALLHPAFKAVVLQCNVMYCTLPCPGRQDKLQCWSVSTLQRTGSITLGVHGLHSTFVRSQ